MKLFRLIMITAGCLAAAACQKPAPEAGAATDTTEVKMPVPVEAMTLAKTDIKRRVTGAGVASGYREVHVVTETGGTVTGVSFALGRYVEKDAVLLTIDSDVQQAALEQAQQGLETARMALAVTEKLHADGSASDMELVQAKAAAAGAKTAAENARKQLERCTVTAPIAGYIAYRDAFVEEGNSIGMGTRVAKIVALHALKTTVNVGEMEVGLLKRGLAADITVPAVGNRTFRGRVSAVGAGADPATGSYPVEVTWSNTRSRAVKSGMSCRVDVITADNVGVLAVPVRAVFLKDGRDAVFTVRDRKADLRFVTTGRTVGDQRVIREGLEPGLTVVTSGMTVLAQGDTLAVKAEAGK